MSQSPHQLILASAGTGKTYNLVVHFVGLLLRDVSPEKILATTFTRKAAGEILDRVLEHLVDAVTKEEKQRELQSMLPGVDASREACLRLLVRVTRSLEKLKIRTLDAFFVQIAKVYALELGLPPDWAIVDEVAAKELQSEAIARMLSDDDQEDWVDLLRKLQGAAGRKVHEEMLDKVGKFREAFAESGPRAWNAVKSSQETLDEAELAAAIQAVRDAPGTTKKDGSPDGRFSKKVPELLELVKEQRWRDVLGHGLVKALAGTGTYYSNEIPQEFAEAAAPLIGHATSILVNELVEQNQATFRFLEQFDIAHRELQAEESSFRFEDLPLRLAPSIGSDPLSEAEYELWFRIDGKVDHLLLDEFQDTSPVQWRILDRIVTEILADGVGERSLFCVGDVKQSIYGFREAEPRLLAELHKQHEELTEVRRTIQLSYRSSDVLLDTVNSVFRGIGESAVMQEDPWAAAARGFQDEWEDHSAAHEKRKGATYLVEATQDTEKRGDWSHVLARVIERVKDIRKEEPSASVGILLRGTKHIAGLIYRLRKEGVRASGEGGNPLIDSVAVLHLLSILHWLDHPGDQQARFHASTSPLGHALGVTEEEGEGWLEVLRELRQRLARGGYGRFCSELSSVVSQGYTDWDQRRFAQLVDLAHAYDARAGQRTSVFVEHVRHQRVEDPTAGLVKVMTIHGSKGLEFDAVILPDLDGKLFPRHASAYTARPNPYGQIEAVSSAPSRDLSRQEPTLDELWYEYQRRGMVDNLCLLYVAMTRAKYRLDVVLAFRKKGAPIVKTLGAALRHALLTVGSEPDEHGVLWAHEDNSKSWLEERPEEGKGAAEPRPAFALAATEKLRRMPRRAPSALEGGEPVDARKLLGWAPGAARHGTFVHRLFEEVKWLEDFERSEGELRTLFSGGGADEEEQSRALETFSSALEHPAIKGLLSKESQGLAEDEEQEVFCEREFRLILTDDEGVEFLANGIIDRLVVRSRGGKAISAAVIDYKSDAVAEAEVSAHAQGYVGQMGIYRKAVSRMYEIEPGDVSLQLAFVAPGVVHSL